MNWTSLVDTPFPHNLEIAGIETSTIGDTAVHTAPLPPLSPICHVSSHTAYAFRSPHLPFLATAHIIDKTLVATSHWDPLHQAAP